MVDQVENGNGVLIDTPAKPRARRALDPIGWSMEAYITHGEAMRAADRDFAEERDRRYKEVNIEKEKALKIKETADLAALGLAREIQDYKDQKANGLREIMQAERGEFAPRDAVEALSDKFDAAHAPVLAYIASAQGRSAGGNATLYGSAAAIATVVAVVSIIIQFGH